MVSFQVRCCTERTDKSGLVCVPHQEPVLFGSATRGTIAENVRYGKPDAT
eukprot:COSAG01_NODE_25176_length_753_cov_1.068807_1_plen_49_part_10